MQKRAEELLRKLIETNTCQPEGNEAKLVDFLLRRFEGKADCHVIEHTPNRASLILAFEGTDHSRCVAFAGHLDTVSCSAADWSHDPHGAEVLDGKMYGRGSSDMKSGVAAMTLTADAIAAGELNPFCDVLFCFTADEEAGGMGALAMSKHPMLKKATALFICEPSAGGIGIAEKGALWLRVDALGKPSHGSRPDLGINAADAVLLFTEQMRQQLAPVSDPFLGSSSFCLTRIGGGTLTNVVPESAFAEFDIRTVPAQNHAQILQLAKDTAAIVEQELCGSRLTVTVLNDRAAIGTDENEPFVQSVLHTADEIGAKTYLRGLNFYTDGSQLVPALDIPFVIAGPGDDKLAHTVDEWVALEDVVTFTKLYSEFIAKERNL